MQKCNYENVRLPAHIKPERYQLTIKPDLEGFVFEGEENDLVAPGKIGIRNYASRKELNIVFASFKPSPQPSPRGGGGKTVLPKKISYDEKEERLLYFREKFA